MYGATVRAMYVIVKTSFSVDISLPKPVCCFDAGVGLIYCACLSGEP